MRLRVLVVCVYVLGMVLLVGSQPASANPIIANGSFEANSGCSPTGWTSVNCQFYGAVSWAGQGWGAAADGSNAFFLCATDCGFVQSLSQTISGFTPGDSYTLSFEVAPEAGPDQGRHAADVQIALSNSSVASQAFQVVGVDGNLLNLWFTQSLTFTATGSSVDMTVTPYSGFGPSWEMGLDNFAISANQAETPVPEPGSLMLLGSGLLVAAKLYRRKLVS